MPADGACQRDNPMQWVGLDPRAPAMGSRLLCINPSGSPLGSMVYEGQGQPVQGRFRSHRSNHGMPSQISTRRCPLAGPLHRHCRHTPYSITMSLDITGWRLKRAPFIGRALLSKAGASRITQVMGMCKIVRAAENPCRFVVLLPALMLIETGGTNPCVREAVHDHAEHSRQVALPLKPPLAS